MTSSESDAQDEAAEGEYFNESPRFGTLSAHILIGPGSLEGVGVPTHEVYLFENRPPTWTLVPTGIAKLEKPSSTIRIDWTPTNENILEDGLLMLGLHVAGFPELRVQADKWFKRNWRGDINLTSDIAIEHLRELHALNREQDWQEHLVITVLCRSEAIQRLHVLRQYGFGMDLCTMRAGRYKTTEGFNPMVCDLNPFSFEEEDKPPEKGAKLT